MKNEVLEYCISRKRPGETEPSWETVAKEIFDKFGFEVGSISGLRSRVAEYRKLARYVPGSGVVVPKSEQWGDGLARVLPKTTEDNFEIVVFVSDIHVPYHDATLIRATAEVIKNIGPHVLVFNGDINDFFQLSRFNRSMERLETLQDEIDMAHEVRKILCEAAPGAVKRETLGNHDERLITYMEVNAPSLKSLRALRPDKLLRLDELDITHFPRQGFRLRDDFVVEHGHISKKESGQSAKSRADATLISGIMGHTHRMSAYHKSGYRKVTWHEQGCLCMRNADYVVGETNWQPGFAVGLFSTKSENYSVQLVEAVGQGFIWEGKEYGNTEAEAEVYSAV